MKVFHEGQLVTLADGGDELDAIVVHAPSLVKIEIAVADAERGTLFRTAHPKVLRHRSTEGEHDEALRRQIRRTSSTGGAGPRNGPGRGRQGHSHVSGHRTTGK
jgi:hypothetical protein